MSYNVQDTKKGRRVDIDGQYKANDRLEAAKKFAKELVSHDYGWVAEAMEESIENGYYYDSNASELTLCEVLTLFPQSPLIGHTTGVSWISGMACTMYGSLIFQKRNLRKKVSCYVYGFERKRVRR